MECDERDAFCSAASQREIDALVALLTTPTTTLAGVVAVLVHLGQPEWFKENPHEDERETILSGAVESTACEEARVFPLLLAATVRSLIGVASGNPFSSHASQSGDTIRMRLGSRCRTSTVSSPSCLAVFKALWTVEGPVGDLVAISSMRTPIQID